jgi:aspartyl-tRNA(Asn)/glutamyl-tRNA(Gln) amidotransferase subunit A
MCRTASDCGLVLEAIAGFDAQDASSIRMPYIPRPSRREVAGRSILDGKRIGVIRPDFKTDGDAEVEQAFSAALEVLRSLGAKLEDTELPDFPYSLVAVTLYSSEAASIFRPLIESEKLRQLEDESQKVGLTAALSIPATDYLDACRLRTQIQVELGKTFDRFDVIVAPSRLRPAPRVDADFNAPPPGKSAGEKPAEKPAAASPPRPDDKHSVVAATNIAGSPAISVPCGFTKDSLPIGIQFVAGPLNEDACIGFARHFQKATEWHLRRPTNL